jgi:hypothetical protein
MKNRTSAVVGLFFIFLMFGSTIAYTLLSGSGFSIGGNKEEVSLPSTNIVYGELAKNVETFAMSKGRTIVKFYYNALCNGCQEQKTYLEYTANQNAGGIILEELTDNNINAPKVSIMNQRGSDELVNATNDAVFDSLCNLMFNPPVDCALRKV